ncbi:pilus assembly protein TadG-related protein [Altererythrobacter sp. TH136]|uniref:TadE/TadG family type IV pilus assembly protein n=1 Tax=Altererythrobacter sp. TH136 TaxID=2067415 RepID=UPI0011649A1D|nr:pilus assembly protein TadG-related protein [Altererythrobacter sp. TH136]QDM39623.1 hypothetical protein C0V74_00060 [Altererythrobacter sp. TH136]
MITRTRQFWRDQGGAVAATYAIALTGLVIVAGVGYDYTRMVAIDSELQNAADQAALAAATQLDGRGPVGTTPGACARASAAAVGLLSNLSMLSNDGGGNQITVTGTNACGAGDLTKRPGEAGFQWVRFFKDRNKTQVANTDAEAKFVEVFVNPREALYALTPIMATARGSGDLHAAALAGVGSAVCKVPPIMICSPDPTKPFNADGRTGQGIVATGHSTKSAGQGGAPGDDINNKWSPGNFGFLQVQDGTANSRNARLLQALAFANPPIDCVSVDGNRVNTGNPQGLYDAINTRFGIYDFPSNGGNALSSCEGGDCPPAPNVIMDHVNTGNGNGGGGGNSNGNNGNGGGGSGGSGGGGGNTCRMGNNGFQMPSGGNEFNPVAVSPANSSTRYDSNISRMGLPRDLCHYDTFNGTGLCGSVAGGRFGDGVWAREDYFATNHAGVTRPTGWETITRYKTYLWEIGAGRGRAPVCGLPAGDANRRVMTLAVVSNCAQLSGTSTEVIIDEWIDAFLVEPSTDNADRHNPFRDAVYFEIIGKSRLAGNGTYSSQEVRRDVPYLIQ